MKKKYILLLCGIAFFTLSAFTYVVIEKQYQTSSRADLSFENRLIYHQEEMYSLENYFKKVARNPSVVEDYNSIMNDFKTAVIKQRLYMARKKITFRQVRANPSILPAQFRISNTQYLKIKNVINATKPVASPYLKESLTTLDEYLGLARRVQYSADEILLDASGTEPNETSRGTEGLQSREAVRKLKDLLRNKPTFVENKVLVYPNPFNESSKVSFYNATKGNVKFTIFNNSTGKIVSSKTQLLKQGATVINASELTNQKLSPGVYILNIINAEGKKTSTKFIIK